MLDPLSTLIPCRSSFLAFTPSPWYGVFSRFFLWKNIWKEKILTSCMSEIVLHSLRVEFKNYLCVTSILGPKWLSFSEVCFIVCFVTFLIIWLSVKFEAWSLFPSEFWRHGSVVFWLPILLVRRFNAFWCPILCGFVCFLPSLKTSRIFSGFPGF